MRPFERLNELIEDDVPEPIVSGVVEKADAITVGIDPGEHEGDRDEYGDPIWLSTHEHPAHPEVAGQPDPRG